jgi:hypothetical protein
VTVTYQRNGKPYTTTVTLRDQKGGTSTRTKADLSVTEKIGAISRVLMIKQSILWSEQRSNCQKCS